MGKSTAITAIRGMVIVAVFWTAWSTMTLGQRRQTDDNPYVTRLDMVNERLSMTQSLSNIELKMADVKRTAEDARQEIRDIRGALYGIATTLIGSLLLQLFQFKKGRTNG